MDIPATRVFDPVRGVQAEQLGRMTYECHERVHSGNPRTAPKGATGQSVKRVPSEHSKYTVKRSLRSTVPASDCRAVRHPHGTASQVISDCQTASLKVSASQTLRSCTHGSSVRLLGCQRAARDTLSATLSGCLTIRQPCMAIAQQMNSIDCTIQTGKGRVQLVFSVDTVSDIMDGRLSDACAWAHQRPPLPKTNATACLPALPVSPSVRCALRRSSNRCSCVARGA